jgi:hypothetical protein
MSETPERPEPLVTDHALFLVWTASCDPTCWVRARPLCEALVELQGTSRQTGQMWVAEEGLPEKVNPDAIFEHVLQRFKATKGGEAKPRRLRLTPLGRDVLRGLAPQRLHKSKRALDVCVRFLSAEVLVMPDGTVICTLEAQLGAVPAALPIEAQLPTLDAPLPLVGGTGLGAWPFDLRRGEGRATTPAWALPLDVFGESVTRLRRALESSTSLRLAPLLAPKRWLEPSADDLHNPRERAWVIPADSPEPTSLADCAEWLGRLTHGAHLAAERGKGVADDVPRCVGFSPQLVPRLLFGPVLAALDAEEPRWGREFGYLAMRLPGDAFADASARDAAIYRLANGFDSTYAPPPRLDDITVCAPAGHRWFAATPRGALALALDQDGGFDGQVMTRQTRDYLRLAHVALHQRQVLLDLALAATAIRSDRPTQRDCDTARDVRAAVTHFHLHTRCREISHSPMHVAAYDAFRGGLRVESLYAEVSEEVAELDDWLTGLNQERASRREQAFHRTVGYLAAVGVVVGGIAGLLGMNLGEGECPLSANPGAFGAVLGVTVTASVGVLAWVRRTARRANTLPAREARRALSPRSAEEPRE